jgi:hypothetical protein
MQRSSSVLVQLDADGVAHRAQPLIRLHEAVPTWRDCRWLTKNGHMATYPRVAWGPPDEEPIP